MKTQIFFSPGRVNIIGEHIDYNGGLVMPIAIEQGITAEVEYTDNNFVNISSSQFKEKVSFNLNETKNNPTKTETWADYALGVIHFLQKEEKQITGCNIKLSSTLPKGSGLSSSAALEVLLAYILLFPKYENIDLEQLAIFCQKVENEFVGVNCGIMDQFAVANGKENFAMCLDCNTLKNQYIPFNLENYSLVIINSKHPRTLADSAYNQRRNECEIALSEIQKHKNITNLCSANLDDLQFITDTIIKKRAKHVISEQQRVLKSIEALKSGNLSKLGNYMTASHLSLAKDYEVSSNALDTIVNEATNFEGCLGARLTGAGFGGCCIALVDNGKINEFENRVSATYLQKHKINIEFYITKAKEGVQLIN